MTTAHQPDPATRANPHRRQRGTREVECSGGPHRRLDDFVLESCHNTWIFDPEHRRFRRILKGIESDHHPVATEWRPYWYVHLEPESEGFTVFLNASRTRLIRSWRHTQDCVACRRAGETAELSLENIHLTLHGYGG
jgi:hypothetical protein